MNIKLLTLALVLLIVSALSIFGYKYFDAIQLKNKSVLSEQSSQSEELFPEYNDLDNTNQPSAWIIKDTTPTPFSGEENTYSNLPILTQTPYPTQIPYEIPHESSQTGSLDSSKMQSIANIFEQIGQLNLGLGTNDTLNTFLGGQLASELQYCEDKKISWSTETLPNGELNPEFIFNPFSRNDLYDQCVNSAYEIFGGSMQSNDTIYSEISSLSNQAYNTALSCDSSECLNYYWEFIDGFEKNGLVAR